MDQGDFITASYTEAKNIGYCKPHKIPGMSAESCATRKNAKPPPASCIKCEGLILCDVEPEAWGHDDIGRRMKKTNGEIEMAKQASEEVCTKCGRDERDCKGQWSQKLGLCNRCYQKWLKKKPPLNEFLGFSTKSAADEDLVIEEEEDTVEGDDSTAKTEPQCPNCRGLESECSGDFNLESGLCDPCYRRWLRRGKPPIEEFIVDEGDVKSILPGIAEESQESVNDRTRREEEVARRSATNSKFSRSAMTSHDTIISVMEVQGGGLLFQGIREDRDSCLAMGNFIVGPEAAQLLVDMVVDWRNGKQ